MHIDQKHVTLISFQDGRVRDLAVQPDGRGYRLTLVSQDEVVTLLLSAQDLHKLRQELAKAEGAEVRKEYPALSEVKPPRPEPATFPPSEPHPFQWSNIDWLSFN